MKNPINYVFLLVLVLFAHCKAPQKQEQTKIKQTEDSTKKVAHIDSTTKKEEKSLPFDSLVKKFKPQTSNEIKILENELNNYYGQQASFYHFSYQDIVTLQLNDLYTKRGYDKTPTVIPYLYKYMKNGVLKLFFVDIRMGYVITAYLATYKNKKIISFTEEPLLEEWADAATRVNCDTKIINDNLFLTTYKWHLSGTLMTHSEITTKIDENGKITQTTKKLVDKEFGK